MPILENNITISEEEVESEEDTENHENGWGDGGKLPKRTQKEILKMINQKYHFANFNILLFA